MFPFDILESVPGGLPEPTPVLLQAVWASAIGDKIAAHTKPIVIRGKTVVVEASKPWDVALNSMRHEVIRHLNAGTPWTFERIEIVAVAPEPVPVEPLEERADVEPDPRSLDALESIEDEDIRAVSARILKRVVNGD